MEELSDFENVISLHAHKLRAGIIMGDEPVACSAARVLCALSAPISAMKPTLPRAPWIEVRV